MEITQTVSDESAVVAFKALSGVGVVCDDRSGTGIHKGAVVFTDTL